MVKEIDFDKLKDKFGELLSRLYADAHYSLEKITDLIIDNEYFDFLERNEADEFLNKSLESILLTVSNQKIEMDYEGGAIAQFLWSGMEYVNISINENVPLRKVLLVLPLTEMISLFPIYHEMNDYALIEKYREIYQQRSVLSLLIKRKDLTQKELSILSGISINTIKYYCKNNSNISLASYSTIKKIVGVLKISEIFLSEGSSFIPYDTFLLSYDPFKRHIEQNLKDYYEFKGFSNVKEETISFLYGISSEEAKKQLEEGKYVIVCSQNKIFSLSDKEKKLLEINDDVSSAIIKKSVLETVVDSYKKGVLLF